MMAPGQQEEIVIIRCMDLCPRQGHCAFLPRSPVPRTTPYHRVTVCPPGQPRVEPEPGVEAILAEAVLANAQLAVAKAVLQAEFRREGLTLRKQQRQPRKRSRSSPRLVFGQLPAQAKPRPRRAKPEVKAL